jgi:hypothetical protein
MSSKNLSTDINKVDDNYFKQFSDWQRKISFLEDQISKFDKLKDFPIFSIASFLLKTQLTEWKLRQLIPLLDFHLNYFNNSPILKLKIKVPSKNRKVKSKISKAQDQLSLEKLTLGQLINGIESYESVGDQFLKFEELKANLRKLQELRNKFVHHIFDIGDIDDLVSDSEKGLKIAEEVIKNIEEVYKILNQNEKSRNTK